MALALPLTRVGASHQEALLWTLAIAVERQLPLPSVLEAYAHDAGGRWRQHALQIAAALRSGTSLEQALVVCRGAVPRTAVLAAQVGAGSGTLGRSLRLAAESFRRGQQGYPWQMRGVFLYLLILSQILVAHFAFMLTFIIPKFKAIFTDFGTALPPLTVAVIQTGNIGASYGILLAPILFAGIVLCVFLFIGSLYGPGALPGIDRLIPAIDMPDVLRVLAPVAEAGRPVVGPLGLLGSFHPRGNTRKAMYRVAHDVERGENLADSLKAARLLGARDAAVLASAKRAGNLSWALTAVAESIERRIEIRFRLIGEFLRPLAVLLVGAIVGVYVCGLFLPLVKLIRDLG